MSKSKAKKNEKMLIFAYWAVSDWLARCMNNILRLSKKNMANVYPLRGFTPAGLTSLMM